MYIINISLVYLIYLVIFIIAYFVVEKLLAWDRIVKQKQARIVEDFIFGAFMGIITLVSQLINGMIYKGFKMPLFVSSIILISIFKEYTKALFTMIPGFIYYLFNRYHGVEIYVTTSFALIMMLIIFYLKIFLPRGYLSFAYATLFIIWFIITTIIGFYEVWIRDLKTTLINISYIYILSLLGYYLMKYIVNFTISSQLLYESSRYAFLKFFRPSIATSSINEFLITNKIKYGLLVLFRLNYSKAQGKLIEADYDLNIENYFYKLVQEHIAAKGILFNYEGNENGFFIPVSKNKNGLPMMTPEFHQVIQILNRKYHWDENEGPLKMTTNFGVAKYGIDSQNINKLITYASFALNEQPQDTTSVTWFNWKIYHSFLKDNYDINHLDAALQLDDLVLTFTPLYNLANHQHFATYAAVENTSEFQTYETARESAYIKNFHNTFDRYFASSALLDARGRKVIVHYAPTIFEEKFLITRFQDFFKRNNIKYSSVYMIFDQRGIDKSRNRTLIKANVMLLQALGINMILPHDCPPAKIRRLAGDCKYRFVPAQDLPTFHNHYPGIELMCYDITTPHEVLAAHRNNVKILGGPMFDQALHFTKFTKQSKMYLENVIKGAQHE